MDEITYSSSKNTTNNNNNNSNNNNSSGTSEEMRKRMSSQQPITLQILNTSKKSMMGFSYTNEYQKYRLNELHTEFLKTCTPCIAFCLTQIILVLPYSIVELINQIKPNMNLIYAMQYLIYIRYLFYCSKFYVLCLVSYRFRRDLVRMFKRETNEQEEKAVLRRRLIKKSMKLGHGNWPPMPSQQLV